MLDLASLNEAQRKAVTYGAGSLLVLAGPGSGKTYTMTQRILYLLEQEHVPPEKILVITFTKDAAMAMQKRFQHLSEQTFPVNFGTFHSVFYHILKESHAVDSNQILNPNQKKTILIPILKQYFTTEEAAKAETDLTEAAMQVLGAIGYYKNTGEIEQAAAKLPEKWQKAFPQIAASYEEKRKQQGGIDFDDMVYECRRLLQRNLRVRRYWQSRFSEILIDEFQDISPMQYEVIRLLSAGGSRVFAVGDDDQSIYGFRGSKPACLKRFAEEYQAEKICLNFNYRSRQVIVEAANLVIGENKDRFAKDLRAAKKEAGLRESGVRLHCFQEREEEYGFLMQYLKEWNRDQNTDQDTEQNTDQNKNLSTAETIGVLFRTNTFLQSFAARLAREGISYTMREKPSGFYEHFLVQDIMTYIKIAQGKRDRALFLRILNRPSRYISREALFAAETSYGGMIDFYRRMKGNAQTERVVREIEKWERQMNRLKGMSPFAAVNFIRRAIGYDSYVKERAGGDLNKWQEWEEILERLSGEAACYDSMDEWLRGQEECRKELGRKKHDSESASVFLMTVHASKGLEFDVVCIPDCNEKIFPHGAMPDEETCEEERRVFYVAMTRAKKSLELFCLTGTEERPRLPSRFLNKLFPNQSCQSSSSISSSNSQLSRYSSKASATFSYSPSSSI